VSKLWVHYVRLVDAAVDSPTQSSFDCHARSGYFLIFFLFFIFYFLFLIFYFSQIEPLHDESY